MKIWIDDIRTPPSQEWWWFGDSETTIKFLELFKKFNVEIEEASFDHDLGGDDTTRPIILWMAENDFWPKKSYVHTANPVGRNWLTGRLKDMEQKLAKVKKVKIDFKSEKGKHGKFIAKFGLIKSNVISNDSHDVLYSEIVRCNNDEIEFKPEFTPKAKAEIRRRQNGR